MEKKRTAKITLVLLTAGALLSQVPGCVPDRAHEADAGGGGVYYAQSDRGWSSGYSHFGGYIYHSSGYHSSVSRGGFGSSGGSSSS